MLYHDILGIRENAGADEISHAYEQKISALAQSTSLTPAQRQRKISELSEAKGACLLWRDKGFSARTLERVEEYSSEFFSDNRASVWIGPCTCLDWTGGFTCCGNGSTTSSFLVECCGLKSAAPAVICDLLIYAGIGLHTWTERRKNKKAAARAKFIESAQQEISALNDRISKLEHSAKILQNSREAAESDLNQASRFAAFYSALGSGYPFDRLLDIQRTRLNNIERKIQETDSARRKASARLSELSEQLDAVL